MKCSNCGTEFNEGLFCLKCGARVENHTENEVLKNMEVVKEEEIEQQEKAGDKQEVHPEQGKGKAVFCIKCGEQIETGLVFCPFCGNRVITDTVYGRSDAANGRAITESGAADKKATGKEQAKKKYIGMFLVVVAIIAVFALIEGISNRILPDAEEKTENTAVEKEPPAKEDVNGAVLAREDESEKVEEAKKDTAEETDALLQDQEAERAATGEEQPNTEEVNPDYETWVGDYVRTSGPSSGISIWEADENGIMFAAGIGSSGYLAYRDIRDCDAEWVDDSTAIYLDGYGGRMQMTLLEDGRLSVVEEGTDGEDILLLSGIYEKSFGQSRVRYEYVLPDSDRRLVTESDLENLSPLECRIARNEIYARHGRLFADEQLQNYFDCCTWYSGEMTGEDFTLDMLSDIERENAEFISAYEEKMGYK